MRDCSFNEDAQPGHDTVVLLSDGFWRRQFAADSAIVGRSIDVDGTPCTVVGVLPSSFKIFRVLNREVPGAVPQLSACGKSCRGTGQISRV
ncbi:MAG: hypothetical protein DMG50_16360 [Acidobacteria bacterium]|nr:MAG: hypothetical protein DMG50_16360 [Acidobacteriota bacterium]